MEAFGCFVVFLFVFMWLGNYIAEAIERRKRARRKP